MPSSSTHHAFSSAGSVGNVVKPSKIWRRFEAMLGSIELASMELDVRVSERTVKLVSY